MSLRDRISDRLEIGSMFNRETHEATGECALFVRPLRRDRAGPRAVFEDRGSAVEFKEAILAAIEAERPAIEAAERERLAKLAEGVDIPTGMSGRAVCTVPGKPIADWIRSRGNEDG